MHNPLASELLTSVTITSGSTGYQWSLDPLRYPEVKAYINSSSTMVGLFQLSFDHGNTYVNRPAVNQNGVFYPAGTTFTCTTGDDYRVETGGATDFRFLKSSGSGVLSLSKNNRVSTLNATGGDNVSATPLQCYSAVVSVSGVLVSASARKFWGVTAFSLDATPIYVKIYDKAIAPTSADTPIFRSGVPANSDATLGAGNNQLLPQYIPLTNGLGVQVVTGIADNSTGQPTASEVLLNILWSA